MRFRDVLYMNIYTELASEAIDWSRSDARPSEIYRRGGNEDGHCLLHDIALALRDAAKLDSENTRLRQDVSRMRTERDHCQDQARALRWQINQISDKPHK